MRFIVGHFKDRVQYFKIWNEPDNCGDPVQCVEAPDMINLGLDVAVRAIGTNYVPPITEPAMRNFFTVMAGATADSLPVAIEGVPADTADIKQYGFTFQNHKKVILWRDIEAQPLENVPGVPVGTYPTRNFARLGPL